MAKKNLSLKMEASEIAQIGKLAKRSGYKNTSDFVRTHLQGQLNNDIAVTTKKMARGGSVSQSESSVPEDLQPILSAGGGVVSGVLLYKIMKSGLDNYTDLEQDTKVALSGISAIACGLLTMDLLSKILSNK